MDVTKFIMLNKNEDHDKMADVLMVTYQLGFDTHNLTIKLSAN